MEGIRKYKKIYKNSISIGFDRYYNGYKKEEISNEKRCKRLEGLRNKNIYWVGARGSIDVRNSYINKGGYIISKVAECRVWKEINKDNHKLFGIGLENFIDESELDKLKVYIKSKKSIHHFDLKYDVLVKEGCVLIDVNDDFKYKNVSVKKNKDKVKEVIIEDYYGSDLHKKFFNLDEEGKKIKEFKVNKDKVLGFYRDRKQLFKDLDKSYVNISRWLNKRYQHILECDNHSGWFLDRIVCEVYYDVKDGKLLTYSDRLHDMKIKGYISDDLVNEIVMMKGTYMTDSDEKMIEWIRGYKERKKEYDEDYNVKKVLGNDIKDNFSSIEV